VPDPVNANCGPAGFDMVNGAELLRITSAFIRDRLRGEAECAIGKNVTASGLSA
jgi:hypothetical protein